MLRVEGRIAEHWVAVLKDAIDAADQRAGSLCLDLEGVDFIDDAGVRMLRDALRERVTILRASLLVRSLLSPPSERQ